MPDATVPKPATTPKSLLKLLVKVLVTGLALWFVFVKIDLHDTWILIKQAQPGWLLVAFVLFNASKILSAFRLQAFFKAIQLQLSGSYNLMLYYLGMFYNFFLPGSIGGDGYKVYLLHKQYRTPVKDLVAATLLDRINGVVALSFLAGILLLLGGVQPLFPAFRPLLLLATILVFPVYYLLGRFFFRKFLPAFHLTNVQSMGVQGLQVLCALGLLYSLDVSGNHLAYLALFLVSSVVSVLPFTIGGIGARELVFLMGYYYLPIDRVAAVSFTMLFFGITAISSLIGVVFVFFRTRRPIAEPQTAG